MNQPSGSIVAGFDGSSDARSALSWAIETAAMAEQPVRVVLADPLHRTPDRLPPNEHELDDALAWARAALMASKVSEWTVERVEGHPEAVFEQLSRDAATPGALLWSFGFGSA